MPFGRAAAPPRSCFRHVTRLVSESLDFRLSRLTCPTLRPFGRIRGFSAVRGTSQPKSVRRGTPMAPTTCSLPEALWCCPDLRCVVARKGEEKGKVPSRSFSRGCKLREGGSSGRTRTYPPSLRNRWIALGCEAMARSRRSWPRTVRPTAGQRWRATLRLTAEASSFAGIGRALSILVISGHLRPFFGSHT